MPETSYIPRTIWTLWFQGLDRAPYIVRTCIESWKRHHPDWEIHVLDDRTLKRYVDVAPILERNSNTITPQKRANIVRMNLLSQYGGVWADATLFCMKPLDHWLDDTATEGFFAFHKPGRDRILANWFMAASRGNHLVRRMNEEQNRFFMDNDFDNEKRRALVRLLDRVLSRNVYLTRFWFSSPVVKLLKVYPYYCFHYLFADLVRKDRECRAIWDRVKRVSADGPHYLQTTGFKEPLTESVKRHIDEGLAPLYKLSWKTHPGPAVKGSNVDYLLSADPSRLVSDGCSCNGRSPGGPSC